MSYGPLSPPGRPHFPRIEHYRKAYDTAPADAAARLAHVRAVVDALPMFARGDDEWEGRRTHSIACRLLGIGWTYIFKAIQDTRDFGADVAGAAWCKDMRPADQRVVGSIYLAAAEADPDLIKVGFSTNPQKRAKSLSREAGSHCSLIATFRATMLDEWAIHCALIRKAVFTEWYRRADLPPDLVSRIEQERSAA
jgi:hypothetical protein